MLPHQQLKKLSFPIELDTLIVKDADIRYLERANSQTRPGQVAFSDINATLYGITNRKGRIKEGQTIEMDLMAEAMNASTLKLHGTFPLYKNGYHRLTGSLEEMNMQKLNSMLEPLELARIESGTIRSMNFDIELGPKRSNGEVYMAYDNLSVELLNKEDIGESDHREVVSFLANTLKIKSSNRKPLRVGKVSFKRDENKSIFNYWWKSLASGLRKSVSL